LDERDVKQLRRTFSLLESASSACSDFYEKWTEVSLDAKSVYESFKTGTTELRQEILVTVKNADNYRDLEIAIQLGRDMLEVAKKLHDLLSGPMILSRAAKDLVIVMEKAVKSIQVIDAIEGEERARQLEEMPGDTEEDRILRLLTEEELATVYGWIEGRS
jgi:hypothetical protein